MQWPRGVGSYDYEEALAEARRQRKPILLALSAPWCSADSDPFACASAQCAHGQHDLGEVHRHFVLTRVDVERRPDLLRRYQPMDLPAVMLLGSDGTVLLAGVPGWAERNAHRRDSAWLSASRLNSRDAALPDLRPAISLVEGVLLTSFDSTHGGFGLGPKHPDAYALTYAIDRYQASSSERWHEVFSLGLDGITQGLFDTRGGGFYRGAAWRDWQEPNTAKLLGTNAEVIRTYVRAYEVTRRAGYLDVASRSLQFALTTLLGPAFYGSLDPAGRLDRTIYLPSNEEMVGTLCLAAQVTGEGRYAEVARRVQGYVLDQMFDPERGFAHYHDGAPHLFGLVLDNAAALVGLARAYSALLDRDYLTAARQTGDAILRAFTSGGSARLGVPGQADQADERLAFGDVVLAAEGLLLLGRLTGSDGYSCAAWQLAAALAADLPGQSPGMVGRFGSLVQDLLGALAAAPGAIGTAGGGRRDTGRPGWGSSQ